MRPILRSTPTGRKGASADRPKPKWKGVLVATFLLVPRPAALLLAQQSGVPPSTLLASAQELASRGDTAGALATLERAVRRFPGLAQAHYLRGLLLSRTASGAITDHLHRMSAEHALERALALDRGNPRYLLELARLKLKMPFLRLEALHYFRRSADEARGRGDTATLAEAEAEIGDVFERRAGNTAGRRILTGGAAHFDPDRALDDWRYAENFINQQSTAVQDPGESDRHEAEDHYRAALAAQPSNDEAARGLLGLLVDAQRYEEFLTAARGFAHAAPGSARAQLALGLGYSRSGRDADASAAFDSALALMSPTERLAVLDLSPILRRADAQTYQRLSPAERREAERIYWAMNDPLKLTAVNEHWIEHLARVAYADIRFTAPDLNLRGWDTDRGVIYIRYGPPPVSASFAAQTESVTQLESVDKITTVWWYPERRLRFVFYGTPGYNVARFAGDFATYVEDARYAAPARYDNVPVNEALDSITVQVARFRDSVGGTSVVFFAGMPVSQMLNGIELQRSVLETGLFISDRLERDIFSRRRQETVNLGDERQFEAHTFEVRLDPGDYLYRLEAREPSSRRAARGEAGVEVAPRPGSGLDLSDVVLANRVAPRQEPARGRRDFFIEPNPAMSYAPGAPVHLYWEVYGLVPDSAGVGAYDVDVVVRLQAIERHGIMARLVGGVADAMGTTAAGDDRVVLTYRRELALRDRDRIPEFLAIDLGGSPAGVYTLEISVTDRHSGQTVLRARTFTVARGAGQ